MSEHDRLTPGGPTSERSVSNKTRKVQIKGIPRNYTAFKPASFMSSELLGEEDEIFADGTGHLPLDESHVIPEFFNRETDTIIQGVNNTLICLGRDRNPAEKTENWSPDILSRSEKSGYSDHMGAGAIDIVVGRMSPFPVADFGLNKSITLGPLYNTVRSPTLQGKTLERGVHPGVMMDAARIYVTQMTDVDRYFNIKNPVEKIAVPIPFNINDPNPYRIASLENPGAPTSAIVLKADKLRMHSRQNMKFVTRGNQETVNSQGNQIQASDVGIHLIANNGRKLSNPDQFMIQHPMVLGSHLEVALHEIVKMVEETTRILNSVVTFQSAFNKVVANHHHETATGPALWNLLNTAQGIITDIEMLTKGNLQCTFNDTNLARFKRRFLNKSSSEYINSAYNTVN
jgi:hypothetical protein